MFGIHHTKHVLLPIYQCAMLHMLLLLTMPCSGLCVIEAQCDELFSKITNFTIRNTGYAVTPTYHIHFAVRNRTDSHPSMADNSGGENTKKDEVDHVGWGSQSWINLGIACLSGS